jgi:hypothetical protein
MIHRFRCHSLEDAAMPKSIQTDADLYARAAAAAARESKDVETYIGELIRLQLRESERMHEIVRALDEIQIEGET